MADRFFSPGFFPLSARSFVLCALCLLLAAAGCAKEEKPAEPVCLVQVGESCMTMAQFEALFGAAAAGLTVSELSDDRARTAAKERYLECVAEEMLVLERARELGIGVDDRELDRAVTSISEDYPDNTFLAMFTEQAVSFSTWREALRRRLLMEKVIRMELLPEGAGEGAEESDLAPAQPQSYTGAEQAGPAETMTAPAGPRAESPAEGPAPSLENAYSAWLEKLKARYPVVVRRELLAKPLHP